MHLFVLTFVFLALGYGSYALKEWLTVKLSIELSQGPKGELSQKATEKGFARELKEAASELAGRAEDFFKAAERDFASRRYRDAALGYQKSLDALPTMSAYLNLGTCLLNISNLKDAGDAFRSGLELARAKRSWEFEAAFLEKIGIVYDAKGELDEALRSYNAALEVYRRVPSSGGQASVLGNIGNIQFRRGMSEQALHSYETALEIFRKVDDRLGEAAALGNIGTIYSSQGRLDDGLKTYLKAAEIYKEIADPLGQASVDINIGIDYKRRGKYEEAVKSQLSALELGRQIDSAHIRALALVNMGAALYEQGKVQQALDSYRSAADISRQTGDRRGEAHALVNLGWTSGNQGNLEDGSSHLQAALKIYKEINSPLDEEEVTFRMADMYFQNRSMNEELKYNIALKYYEAGLEMAKQIGHVSGQATAFGGIGAILASQNKPQEAMANLQRKLTISRSISDPLGEADALSMMGMVYYALNKNSEALQFLNQARAIYITTGLEPKHLQEAERFIRVIHRENK